MVVARRRAVVLDARLELAAGPHRASGPASAAWRRRRARGRRSSTMSSSGAPRFHHGVSLPAGPRVGTATCRPGCQPRRVLECVVNISEGRDPDVIAAIAGARRAPTCSTSTPTPTTTAACSRSSGEAAPRRGRARRGRARSTSARTTACTRASGVVDVVPFVALGDGTTHGRRDRRPRRLRGLGRRRATACRASSTDPSGRCPTCAGTPSARSRPTAARPRPHPTAGAIAVGARPVLVAYNLWLAEPDLDAGPTDRGRGARPGGPRARAGRSATACRCR